MQRELTGRLGLEPRRWFQAAVRQEGAGPVASRHVPLAEVPPRGPLDGRHAPRRTTRFQARDGVTARRADDEGRLEDGVGEAEAEHRAVAGVGHVVEDGGTAGRQDRARHSGGGRHRLGQGQFAADAGVPGAGGRPGLHAEGRYAADGGDVGDPDARAGGGTGGAGRRVEAAEHRKVIAAAGAADVGVREPGVAHLHVVQVGPGAVDQAVRLHQRAADANTGVGRLGARSVVDGDLEGEALASRAVGDGPLRRCAVHGHEQRQHDGKPCPEGLSAPP
ncbi:hypothetical protein GCM10010206_45230 [Streptomyces cinerochromogenes]|nr:hypothetical protein GCM10010206_45230 [Streptomyces cinerochromogenes]